MSVQLEELYTVYCTAAYSTAVHANRCGCSCGVPYSCTAVHLDSCTRRAYRCTPSTTPSDSVPRMVPRHTLALAATVPHRTHWRTRWRRDREHCSLRRQARGRMRHAPAPATRAQSHAAVRAHTLLRARASRARVVDYCGELEVVRLPGGLTVHSRVTSPYCCCGVT